jgi:hypothetical protein
LTCSIFAVNEQAAGGDTVEGEAGQQCLSSLCVNGSTRDAAGELAFCRRKDAFDQGAFSLQFCREVFLHLKAHAECSATGAAFSWNHAVGLQLLATKSMMAFRIGLRSYQVPTGDYAPNGNVLEHVDSVMGTWAFSYDAVVRLTSATAGANAPTQYQGKYGCWTCDSFGNRTLEAF